MTQPANLLMEFVLSLVIPFLSAGSLTDAAFARRAAEETIAAYKAAGQDQLVTVAQLVGFALAALDNLRLSMPPELSLPMKLRLRGNAGTLNRASQHATVTLDRQRHAIAQAQPQRDQTEVLASLEAARTVVQQALAARTAATAPDRPAVPPPAPNPPIATPVESAATPAGPAPGPGPASAPGPGPSPATVEPRKMPSMPPNRGLPPAASRDSDLAWASAMTGVAAEYTAELPNLSPEQQQAQLTRIAALTHIAAMLGAGEAPPLKARLLAGTALRV